jgi:isocitrate/isopropylmalate dehydrogenase
MFSRAALFNFPLRSLTATTLANHQVLHGPAKELITPPAITNFSLANTDDSKSTVSHKLYSDKHKNTYVKKTSHLSDKKAFMSLSRRFLHSLAIKGSNIVEQMQALQSETQQKENKILLIKGQGIGPECVIAAKKVLAATGVNIGYTEGSLGYPDAHELFPLLQQKAPEIYALQFGAEDPVSVAQRLEYEAKLEAKKLGNINDFYKKLLAKLNPEVLKKVKSIIFELEKQTLKDAQGVSAVLKGALRTLDEGDEPSRNVTIRKALEQYANIRRCVTLDPIAPGIKGADILFVRENVEDLYASIEHRLARNYPQALRHQTPEGCELICRAAFEAALRDGRKKVTALEKPNILKITGGLFKETFFRVAKDYSKEKLGERGVEANFMIIDDGLASIAVSPEKFDVVVTSNMFGDIGSDIAAKVTGGVGLVSSNNTNPNNPKSVSMFETMGGTADDIAGQNKANPVAFIDAAAEMLLHIGGKDNMIAAELIKAAVLEVLADGYYVGDIQKGSYQEARGKEKLGTQEFAEKVVEKINELRLIKAKNPEKTIKQIALERASEEVKPLFRLVLRSYEQYANDMQVGSSKWLEFVKRNMPPNPPRADSKIIGFDMFVDNSGLKTVFSADGAIDSSQTKIDAETMQLFTKSTGIDLKELFKEGEFSSIQSLRSFGQYSAQILMAYMYKHPEKAALCFGQVIEEMNLGEEFSEHFSDNFKGGNFFNSVSALLKFEQESIRLIQSFYRARANEIEPILKKYGFKLARITSRGTEIYPTMCDFEKRDVDRFRVEIDPASELAQEEYDHAQVQSEIMSAQAEIAKKGWVIAETVLNRNFTDGEGPNKGRQVSGVSVPYGKNLGSNYVESEEIKRSSRLLM